MRRVAPDWIGANDEKNVIPVKTGIQAYNTGFLVKPGMTGKSPGFPLEFILSVVEGRE